MSYFSMNNGAYDRGELLVRNFVDDLIRRLRQHVVAKGAPLEGEHRNTLRAARFKRASFAERSADWRARTAGRDATDSAELIRADRDRDYQT
jgi:hypothetical protein